MPKKVVSKKASKKNTSSKSRVTRNHSVSKKSVVTKKSSPNYGIFALLIVLLVGSFYLLKATLTKKSDINSMSPSYQISNSDLNFSDLVKGSSLEVAVQELYTGRIITPCSTAPLRFCPDQTLTRDQAAVYLLRLEHGGTYTPPVYKQSAPSFADVPTSHWAYRWIEQLKHEGITSGCGNGKYCPSSTMTRAQFAVFILKIKHGGSYSAPIFKLSAPSFADVPTSHWAYRWIEELKLEGITAGCSTNPLKFCPDAPITRGEMAIMIASALHTK